MLDDLTRDDLDDVPPRRFRLRFSLLALLLLVTAVCILLGWYVQPEYATATALFEVSGAGEGVFRDPSAPFDDKGFEILKKTQLAKLKSNYVLTAAVRSPGIAGLAIFRGKPDVVDWLSENLELSFPQDGEILEISLNGLADQKDDLVMAVDAVAKAYKAEVIYAERQRRLATRDLLARSFENLSDQIKQRLEEYNAIARESGRIESGSGQVLQQLDIKRLDRVEEELMRLVSESASDSTKAKAYEQRIVHLEEQRGELEKRLTARAENSADLQSRRNELERLQKAADELAMKLEMLDIEASAPDPIRQVQQAVIKHDD
jgi:hypothetical protein